MTAKICNPDCTVVCDFCYHFDFNDDDEGAYTGDGFCNKKQKPRDPGDTRDCEDFICFRVKIRKPNDS